MVGVIQCVLGGKDFVSGRARVGILSNFVLRDLGEDSTGLASVVGRYLTGFPSFMFYTANQLTGILRRLVARSHYRSPQSRLRLSILALRGVVSVTACLGQRRGLSSLSVLLGRTSAGLGVRQSDPGLLIGCAVLVLRVTRVASAESSAIGILTLSVRSGVSGFQGTSGLTRLRVRLCHRKGGLGGM